MELASVVLPVLAKELALPASKLIKQVRQTAAEVKDTAIREAIRGLTDAGLVKKTASGGDAEPVYSITAKGVMELSRTKPAPWGKLLL